MTQRHPPSYYINKNSKKQMTNCPYCKTRIRTIKGKNGQKITVDQRPVYYYYQPDGICEIITPLGTRQKGIIVSDGREGYIEHVCRKRTGYE